MNKLNFKKSDKGIALITLVISIIAILILASVSIRKAMEESGIITQAKDAKEDTEYKEIFEILNVEVNNVQLRNGGNIDFNKYIEQIRMNKNLKIKTLTKNSNTNAILITEDGYIFDITEKNEDIEIKYNGKE